MKKCSLELYFQSLKLIYTIPSPSAVIDKERRQDFILGGPYYNLF